MGKQEIILTAEGLRKLQDELEHLRAVVRPEVAERIRQAKAFGDITENSEYDVAKAEQAQIEGRVEALQYILQTGVIATGPDHDGRVSVGSRVRLRDIGTGDEVEYFIVGALEADPAEFRISNQSPLGESLMGHTAGETVNVTTPRGLCSYTVLSVGE
jgi:transcription elongation factor GreA